ncbi:MAG: LamG-like jellyroll fold domain-containing protein, partial [Thermoanaerobaculia bacterium]
MNGGSAYVSIPDAPALRPSTLTVEGWFMFTSVPSWAGLVSKPFGSGADDSFALFYESGALKGQTSNGSTATIVSHAWTPTLNVWHHLAFTFDGSVEALYIDGQQVATLPNTTTPAYDANPLLIGADDDHPLSGFFPGMIDDVALYGAALPPSAIAAIHQAGTSGKCVNAAPSIASLSRVSGPPAGRTPITITGTGFDSGATVTFGGTLAMDVVVESSATIHCVVPARSAGAAAVAVANPDLQSASTPYTYFAPTSADPYAATVLSHSPVAYYRLGESAPAATAYDSSGNDFHALNSGATAGAAGVTWNDGAFTFDGSGSLTLGGTWGGSSWQQLTIEAWVNVAATSGDFQAAVSASDAAFAHLQLFGSGNIVVYTDAGQLALPIVSQSPTGTWRHLALAVAPGNTRVYVDGVEVGSSAAGFSSVLQSIGVQIGSGFGGSRAFIGRIDEVALYDRALSASEIQSHHAARASGEVHWINPAGGNWSSSSNWSSGVVPSGVNPVHIDAAGTYTVVVDVAASAASLNVASGVTLQVASPLTVASGGTIASGATLQIAGGTLSDSGAMTLNGALVWTAGTLSGTGTLTIASGATFALSGTTYKDLVGRTIELYGSMTWSGYGIRGSGGPTLNIRPGGVLDVQTSFGIEACCAGGNRLTINVSAASGATPAGRITKNGGGNSSFSAVLNNAGLVSAIDGSLSLPDGGTSSGIFEAKPSSGTNGIYFSGGTHSIAATLDSIGGGTIAVTGGTFSVDGPTTSTAAFNLAGGTLTGTGALTSLGSFDWTGGAITGSGSIDTAAGTTFALTGLTYKDITFRTINVSGTMTYEGYPLRGSQGAVLNILPGGSLVAETDYGIA